MIVLSPVPFHLSKSGKSFSVLSVPPWCIFSQQFQHGDTESTEFTRRNPILRQTQAAWPGTTESGYAPDASRRSWLE